jgi:hypothetical protein
MDPDAAALLDLASRRSPPCPVCDYNLHGIREARCPECGAALRLEIGSENLRLGPWLLAMLGPALAIGFDGVVTVLMTVGFSLNPPRGPAELTIAGTILGVFVALVAGCALIVAALVRRRKAWHRRPLATQWRHALFLLASVFAVHATYGIVMITFMH